MGQFFLSHATYKLKRGLKAVIRGHLPMGGLSSSAAVTTAYLMALADVNSFELSKEDLIPYSHWVETKFMGLNNGILDQSANVLSRDGYLIRWTVPRTSGTSFSRVSSCLISK